MPRDHYPILKPAPSPREVVAAVNLILSGKLNIGGEATLATGSGTMRVLDPRASTQSIVLIVPPRLSLTWAVTERSNGYFDLAWSGAVAGDVVSYAVFG